MMACTGWKKVTPFKNMAILCNCWYLRFLGCNWEPILDVEKRPSESKPRDCGDLCIPGDNRCHLTRKEGKPRDTHDGSMGVTGILKPYMKTMKF